MRSTPYHQGEHLPLDALEDATEHCPACAFSGLRESVHLLQTEPDVHLLECPICGICSASHMPTDEALERYYAKYYEGDSSTQSTADSTADAKAALTFSGSERFAQHIARHTRAHMAATPHLRLLDFGGGDGTLAIALANLLIEEGFTERVTLTLVDYTQARPSPRSEITLYQYRELGRVPKPSTIDHESGEDRGRFDLIIASAILEHVPHVGPIARRLFEHATAGALLYARTPYWVPLLRFAPKLDLTFPGHVHDMGAPFWNRVVETFALDAELVVSQPSIVETTLRQAPLRTIAAHLLKLPARAEAALRGPGNTKPLWGLVGGWEVFLKFRDNT